MGNKIVFAIDKNLDLAIDDPVWRRFFQKFHILPVLYTDMQKLTEDMEKNEILLSYLPMANFFYFRSDRFYTPIANALFSMTRSSKITSLLIVSKESSTNTLEDLKGKRYGYIHRYCTSSYFAIALLLWRHRLSIHRFFSSLKEVGAWQLQIDAVVEGEIDATMVSEDVWRHLPSNAQKTKIIAIESNLPSPPILVGKGIDPTLLSELKDLLFSYQVDPTRHSMFTGFVPFEKDQTDTFFSEAAQALSN